MSRTAVNAAPISVSVPQNKREMPKLLPSGSVYRKLTATSEFRLKARPDGRNRCYQRFDCACGNFVYLAAYSVKSGNTSSCGCLHSANVSKLMLVHGQSKTSVYRVNMNRNRRGQKKASETEPIAIDDLTNILSQYDNKCWICDDIIVEVSWDHHHPLSKGGSHTKDNLRPSCKMCNSKKSNHWPFTEEMRQRIAEEVRASRISPESTSARGGSEVNETCPEG